MPSTKFVFFGPIRKTRRPPWPLIGRDIFDFSSETAEPNSTELDRKQDPNALYQVFLGRSEKQNGRPGLWLAETFSTSMKKPLNGILQNLTGSKLSMPPTTFVFFRPIWKKCSWHRTCIKVFGQIYPRADPGQGENRWRGQGGGGFFKKVRLQTGRLQQQTKCIAMIYKHVGWSVVIFCSIPKSIFFCVHCSQVSDSGLSGLLFAGKRLQNS